MSGRICTSLSLGTSCHGIKWTKHRSTVKFINNIPTSSHYFTAADAQQFGTTSEESCCKYKQTPPDNSDVALISMLSLFHNQAKSVAMIRHSMNIVKTAVAVLNPGQVPCDQPLYTVAKQIQWTWQETHGEDHFVIMFGGLYTLRWQLSRCLEIFWKIVGGLEHSPRPVLQLLEQHICS